MKYHGLIGSAVKDTKTTSDEDKFSVENPIFCYLAGLISADGYISDQFHRVQLRLVVECRDILDKLAVYFNISNGVKLYHTKGGFADGREMADLTISSKKLLDELAKLNVSGKKKDNNLRVPDFNNMTDECQEMFIRGLWDGDGWGRIIDDKHNLSIFVPSEMTADALVDFFSTKLGVNMYVSKKFNDNGILIGYTLNTVTLHSVTAIATWMYKSNLDYKIEYKYNKYNLNK